MTLNTSEVTPDECDGVRSAAVGFEGSDFGDRVVLLIRSNLFGMDGKIGSLQRDVAGRRNLDGR